MVCRTVRDKLIFEMNASWLIKAESTKETMLSLGKL